MEEKLQKIYFAAGCFWGVEDVFSKINGVTRTQVGYSGGDVENPTYELVCGGGTGHAETVEITFDPSIVTYEYLVRTFFTVHNPTMLNKQGADIGTQYRSIIFYTNDSEKEITLKVRDELEKKEVFESKIVTEIVPFTAFYPAEEYHQKYSEKRRMK